MRICLIARNRFHNSRSALTTHWALVNAGHELDVVAVDKELPREPVTRTVPRRSQGNLTRIAERLQLTDPTRNLMQRMASSAAATDADLFLPIHKEMLPVALAAARKARHGVVYRTPRMSPADDLDLIHLAPGQPDLALPVNGLGDGFTPASKADSYHPRPGRHQGQKAVICYRKTQTNPGRYLEAALVRSGMDVRVETDEIDLSTVDPDTRFILFVESPYPAIEVSNTTAVPVLFWVHHGEHHLKANLRLTDRYKADAVLLAHSWHLAFWFPTRVHRFPFAIAPELVDPSRRLAERTFDVAMVGSNLRGGAWQYRRRGHIVESLEEHFPPERLALREGVTPEEMAALYANSRVVVDEGGIRHFPITMRVFEAIGSGAVLLTDPAPGLEMIFDPDRHYRQMTDDVFDDVQDLIDDLENAQAMSSGAQQRANERHTYDHRVDALLEVAAETTKRELPEPPAKSELAQIIDEDVEVQRLIHDVAADLADELPDREIWGLSERSDRLSPSSMDALVITQPESVDEELLDTPRRYIYASGDIPGIEDYLKMHRPNAQIEPLGRFRRIDLMSDSYRLGRTGRLR